MPIRMTPDEPGDDQRQRPNVPRQRGGGGTGGGGGALIGMLLPMLLKNPKLLIIGVVILGAVYFMGGMDGCGGAIPGDPGGGGGGISDIVSNLFNKGATLDPAEYDKAEVYEPLVDNVKNPIPESASLSKFAPPRLNQGQQGSCVAWASAYAARSIIQNQATGATPSQQSAFSPSFMYNSIKIENSGCQGSYILRAMDDMLKRGAAPYSAFAYDDQDCSRRPDAQAEQSAQRYKIKGFQRLSKSDDPNSPVDMGAMKQYLAQGSPVVIGMMVGGSFMQEMQGQDVWIPNQDDTRMAGFGGHAMCVIGYDDYKLGAENGGAFQIMNSWGTDWGNKGIAWVPYDAFGYFTKEAYAVYPMGESADVKPAKFDIRFGLAVVDAKGKATGENIALKHMGGRTFRTERALVKGTRFKVEVTNSLECYTYIFGQETDGSTYTLFPYTPKHSPYCGITGTRVFPKDNSLTIDDVGTMDVMAILVANQAFDYPRINESMKANSAQGLNAKLEAVLGAELTAASGVQYAQGTTFGATAPANANALAIVIEVEKR